MEQSHQAASDYCDMISSLYPKLRIFPLTLGTTINHNGDVIVDEHRDEWYGCDDITITNKLASKSTT